MADTDLTTDGASGAGGELDRAPIARITVTAGTQVVSRGTGTLVAPKLVLSALHVVANRRTDPPEPYAGDLALEFPGFTTKGTILTGNWDKTADWVLIECADDPPNTKPMRLAALQESKREWQSFGFPDANARDGLMLTGTVMQCEGELEGTRAHQLFSPQAAAGAGGRVKGMSGAPVIIDGALIGVMRFALMENDRTEMGTLYACPVAAVGAKVPTLAASPLPKVQQVRLTDRVLAVAARTAGWEIGAFAGALVVIAGTVFALSQLHVPSSELVGSVETKDVQFTIPASAKVPFHTVNRDLLFLRSLDADGIASLTLPDEGGRRRKSVETTEAHFREPSDGAAGQLALDLGRPLPKGAHVVLHRTDAGRFRLRIDSLREPVTVQFNSSVQFSGDRAQWDPLGVSSLDSALMQPAEGEPLRTEFELERKTVARLDSTLQVSDMGFFDRQQTADRKFVRVPTIVTGKLHLDGPGGLEQVLSSGDSLLFGGEGVHADTITFSDSGAIRVSFSGRVTHLLVAGGEEKLQRNLMPTWLERFREKSNLPIALIVAAALVMCLAYLLVRWRRRLA